MSKSVEFRVPCLRGFPTLLALVALAALMVSCGQVDTSGDSEGTLITGLLSQVPDGYQEVTRWDVAGLLRAEGLEEVQDDFKEQWEWTEQYGIFMDDVSEMVRATDDLDDTLILFAGQFEWDDIRDDLDDTGFRDSTYRDVEVWEDHQGGVVLGLLEERNQVVLSTTGSAVVRDAIRALDRGSGFLFEEGDSDLSRVLGKVPEGLQVIVEQGCSSVDVRGCRAVAYSAHLAEGKASLAMEWAFLFRRDSSARSGIRDIEDHFDDVMPREVDIGEVVQEKEFLLVRGSIDEEDFSLSTMVVTAHPTPTPQITPEPTPTPTPIPSVMPSPTPKAPQASGRIAFVSHRDGNSEIYVMEADGSNRTRLTDKSSPDSMPVWSPDGSKIAYASVKDNIWQIFVMEPDGSKKTQISRSAGHHQWPAWSPDGKKIAFSNPSQIRVMASDGSNQTPLTSGPGANTRPAWSPNGKRIAFVSGRDGNLEIYVMDSDGSNQTRLTNNPKSDHFPAWSPDGTKIAFDSTRDGTRQIYVMNVDGSEMTQLTHLDKNGFQPAWSPDGSMIIFASNRDRHIKLFVMNADGSAQTKLFTENNDTEHRADWGPAAMPIPTVQTTPEVLDQSFLATNTTASVASKSFGQSFTAGKSGNLTKIGFNIIEVSDPSTGGFEIGTEATLRVFDNGITKNSPIGPQVHTQQITLEGGWQEVTLSGPVSVIAGQVYTFQVETISTMHAPISSEGDLYISGRALSSAGHDIPFKTWLAGTIPTLLTTSGIEVLYPNGGEVWDREKPYTIRWESKGITGDVKIMLKGGTYPGGRFTLTASTANTGSYQYSGIPNNYGYTEFRIQVMTVDGLVNDESNGEFSVTQPRLSQESSPQYLFNIPRGQAALNSPVAVAVDDDGNIYAALSQFSQVIKLSPDGDQLWHIGASRGSEDGQFFFPRGIVVGRKSNVYVVDTHNHRVQILNPDGELLGQFGGQGSGDGQFDKPTGVAVDGHGNVYVADPNNRRVQVFGPGGEFRWELRREGSGDYRFSYPSAVAVHSNGDIYVVDSLIRNVQVFNSEGEFLRQFGESDSGNRRFCCPWGVALDESDHVHVVYNHRVQVYDSNGVFLRTYGDEGLESGQFKFPRGIALDGASNTYIADTRNDRIQVFDPSGQFLRQLGTKGFRDGQFNRPTEVAVGGNGNIYVIEQDSHRVQVFNSSGKFLRNFGSPGSSDGQFLHLSGIAVDSEGNVYVADDGNDLVQVFSSGGKFLRKFGVTGSGDGQSSDPGSVAVSNDGKIYVADRSNHRVLIISSDGQFLGKFGSRGSDDGQIASTSGVAVDSDGNIYVADTGNVRVQVFNPEGDFLWKFSTDVDSDEQAMGPVDIAVGADGKIYLVVALDYDQVRVFSPEGEFLAKFGTQGSGAGQFAKSFGIAVDDKGKIYVADTGRHRVQVFGPILNSSEEALPPEAVIYRSLDAMPETFVDQFFDAVDPRHTASASLKGCCQYVAQSFTAGVTGMMVGVSLELRTHQFTEVPPRIAIRRVVDGFPGDAILSEAMVTSWPTELSDIILLPTPVEVVAGEQYAIVVDHPGASKDSNTSQGNWAGSATIRYAKGNYFRGRGHYFTNARMSPGGIDWTMREDIDLWFRTHMKK